jgi:5-methylcytosine-specific restriction endonuclease McrBC GTP-binding regulatory subunit McrB|tara:strand:+ start:3918 stop:6200 length:2283 start_codon:yes stop_codon:yes gene_type:complete
MLEFEELLLQIEQLVDIKIAPISTQATSLVITKFDRAAENYTLVQEELYSKRSFNELKIILNDLNINGYVSVDRSLYGGGSSRNKVETIFANLPRIQVFKYKNKKHLLMRTHDIHVLGEIDNLSIDDEKIVCDKIDNHLSLNIRQLSEQQIDLFHSIKNSAFHGSGGVNVISEKITTKIETLEKKIQSAVVSLDEVKNVNSWLKDESIAKNCSAKNSILYGPPGTGKTFSTIDRVVQALDSDFEWGDRDELKARYDLLVNNGQVIFTTFHQSYSYEDFVEGIRAKTNKESKSISYDVEPGVFKSICESASDFEVSHKSKLEGGLAGRNIWKMSLGNTYIGEEDSVYDYCIENGVILLGYGDDIDFSNCKNSTQVYDEYKNAYEEVKPKDFAIQVVNTFVNKIGKGDLVIISDGNHKFRAIAEITGDYYCLTKEQAEASYFQQARSVKWLLTYDQSRPKEELFKKNLSQMTLYQLHDRTVSREKLELLLRDDAPEIQDKQYAIVIDEINRGNISKIFGELITLIEPSKREGQSEALSVTLPYSKEPFSVPSNLHIIGTMNTADRSLALLDTALRRRFDFIEMMPDYDVLKNEADDNYQVKGINLALMLKAMNDRIEYLYDREHTLGHAFLIPVVELIKNGDEGKAFEELKSVFMNKILPLLEEYFYEDWSKIALVLGDNQKDSTALINQRFVVEQAEINVSALFGRNHAIDDYGVENKCYQLNTAMQVLTAAAFIAIYDVDKAKSLTDKLITSDVTFEETA